MAQVVWCLEPNDDQLMPMAHGLQGKRVAAGEGGKSAIVTGNTPDWPHVPGNPGDIRLYVVAHGATVGGAVPPRVDIMVGGRIPLTAKLFFDDLLQKFLQKVPGGKVKRISLVMCNTAGVDGPEAIPLDRSFAQQLVDLCGALTTDIVGRRGEVDVNRDLFPKDAVDRIYQRLPNPQPNPLHTVTLRGAECSVVNARKWVDDARSKFRTYIFRAGQRPELKPGYGADD